MSKRSGALAAKKVTAADPGYYQAEIYNQYLYDSKGNLVAYYFLNATGNEYLAGFTPVPGEEYTLKAEMYYNNDKSEGEEGEEEGLQSVGLKFEASCSPYMPYRTEGKPVYGDYRSQEIEISGVPSHIHGPKWAHLGNTPPPARLPGAPISFTYKYDPELCAESYRAQVANNIPQDSPYIWSLNFVDRMPPSSTADNEWPLFATNWASGNATPGVPVSQTYGTTCNGNSAGVNNCQSRQGYGVNTATGAFGQEASDAVVAGIDPIALTRSYSSDNAKTGVQEVRGLRLAQAGILGPGWSTPWEASLKIQDNGDVVFHAEDGSEYPFTQTANGFAPPITSRSNLAKNSDGYALTTRTGGLLEFDSSGLLLRSTTKLKRTTTYKRDTSGQITSLVASDGKTVDFNYADSRLSSLILSDGRSITYGYTGGRLSDVSGPNGKLGYTYDSSGRLDGIKDQRGNTVLKNTYDSSGRVERQEGATGAATVFSYKGDETDVTAPDGGVWTDIHKENVLIAQYDPFGNKTSYGYTFGLDAVATTDALGNTITSGVDSKGRPSSFNTSLSKRSWGYKADGSLSWYQNGNKKTTSYKYDADGRLVSAGDFLKKTQTFTYTPSGQLETLTDPRGKTTSFGYDTAGNQTSATYPNHDRLTRGFDQVGRVTSVTDPRGNDEGADPAKYTTVFTYDAAGRLDTTRDARGNTTDRDYDPAGNLTSIKDAKSNVTRYTYDEANRLKDTIDATQGTVSSLTYDSMGRVSSSTDGTGAKTTYTYDKAGRLYTMIAPRGNVAGADPAKYTWTYGYDKVGNQTTVTDPLGKTTKTDYDAESRPVLVTDPLGHTRATKYDAESNVVETKDALTKATTYTYDDNSQLKSVTDRDARVVSYGYDDAGNLTSETTPLGNKTTYAYDDNGRLTDTVEPRGNVTGADPAQYTWHTSYDAAGNVAGVTDPLGNSTTRSYDTANNLVRSIDARKNATDYGYDELNQLTNVQAPDIGSTVLTYDGLGNLKTRTDAKQHVTAYEYDKASRLTKVTDPLLRSTAFKYDPDGNRTLVTNARGQTQTSAYDARNLLTKNTYSDGTPTVTYTYDDARRPKTIADGTGTRTLEYDNADRPLSVTSPGATNPFKYTYNNSGQVKTRTYPDGYAVSYDYDGDGRVKTQTTGGKTFTYGWDEAGDLTSTQVPTTTALAEARTYDRAGRLASISEGTGTRKLTRDADGRLVADQFTSATTTGLANRYGYDTVGRLTRACTDTATTASCLDGTGGAAYGYDKVGNLSTTTNGTIAVTNTYDAADQLTKRVAGSTTTDLTYDADGNLTKDDKGTYAYDAANRVKSATIGADAFTFVLDADGNRTITNKNSKLDRTSRWDINNPLAQIATDTDSTNALIADYNYNPSGIPQAMNRTSGVFYFLHDRQESIRAVHDAAGKENYTYTYTPWGEDTGKASSTNGQTSIFGYTGQYKDPYLTGRLDLRARNYTPSTGRFTTTDPVPADTRSANPSSYAYANNDPVNQADPSGKCPLCVSAGIGAAFGAVLEGGIYSWQHRDGGFSWGGLAEASGEGAVTGGIAGALMPGAGNAVARSFGFTGGRALVTSTGVNAAVGAGFSWGINQVHCRPTDPWDLLIGAAGGGSSSLLGPAFSWLKNRLFMPPVTVSAHTNGGLSGYAFRGLRPDEDPTQGLKAAGSNPDVPAWQHVVQDNDSPWISLTRDPSIAWAKFGGQGEKSVVAVDLSKVDSEMIDAAAHLHVPHEMYQFAKDNAFREKEILVKFSIHSHAIVKHWPAGTSFEQIMRDIAAFE
ncbi:RHS repeat-associated core domain-containing protein [Streptomyces mirabilis]|uniref:RHS repeat-associated core domain-containing protein n=1 Tax=Streptomyces mirabilis TaxID=68239 RepID=UPI0036470F93